MSEQLTIKPVAGRHAIEVMAIGIEWARPLSSQQLVCLDAVYAARDEVNSFLPVKRPVRKVQFQFAIGGQESSSMTDSGESAGYDFTQLKPNGELAWSVSVRPDFITCNCAVYDRWKNVKPVALRLLMPFLQNLLGEEGEIKGIGLQYQDAIRVNSPSPKEARDALFERDSKWIPEKVRHHESVWHVHQGWFSPTPDGRRVHNALNVELLEEKEVYLARIHGQHRILALSLDGKKQMSIQHNDIDSALDVLHELNKSILRDLLSAEVQKKISLNSEEVL